MRETDEETKAKLEQMTQRLEAVKRQHVSAERPAKPPGDAARAAIDFASATTVGTLLGYGVDAWLDTLPWGLLGGLLLGTLAGLKMMLQAEARRNRAEAERETKDKDH